MNEGHEAWQQRRLPLTLWELGNVFRGKMLAAGWTLRQFEDRIVDYNLNDMMLAVQPMSAMGDLRREGEGPRDMRPAGMKDAPGIPMSEDELNEMMGG